MRYLHGEHCRNHALDSSRMTHMLADIDQLVTEHAIDPSQFSDEEWWARLRIAVNGTDYPRPERCYCEAGCPCFRFGAHDHHRATDCQG